MNVQQLPVGKQKIAGSVGYWHEVLEPVVALVHTGDGCAADVELVADKLIDGILLSVHAVGLRACPPAAALTFVAFESFSATVLIVDVLLIGHCLVALLA